MVYKFYKHLPNQDPIRPDSEGPFTVIVLHRELDPDSLPHTGYDYIGVYGDNGSLAAIAEWADSQNLEEVSINNLPNPISHYSFPDL